MKILLVNFSSRCIAGTETYLADLWKELEKQGHSCAFYGETNAPTDRPPIAPVGGNEWFGESGWKSVCRWNPAVVLANGRLDPRIEERTLGSFPCVYFAHNYYGTCISGLKTHRRPSVQPCERTLGLACLGLYLPLGCGGSNPLTMFRLYNREQEHLRRLRGYRAIITHSERMREEYRRHGIPDAQLHAIPFACFPTENLAPWEECVRGGPAWDSGSRRLLFAGRMEDIKGGAELINAAAELAQADAHPVELTMAGEGERKEAWRELAQSRSAHVRGFQAHFPGWLKGDALTIAYRQHHLFVMPSRWPEPFGKGGMEAACHGCPSVAYAVGGIPSWLEDGGNGYLANGGDHAVTELATALRKALADEEIYRILRAGARRKAEAFTSEAHVRAILPLLAGAAAQA